MKDIDIEDLNNAFPIMLYDNRCYCSDMMWDEGYPIKDEGYDFSDCLFYMLNDVFGDDDEYYDIVDNELYTEEEVDKKLEEWQRKCKLAWTYKNGSLSESRLKDYSKSTGIKILRGFAKYPYTYIIADEKLTDKEWLVVSENLLRRRGDFVAGYFKKKRKKGVSVVKLIKEYKKK